MNNSRLEALTRLLEEARKRLIETGGRNKLIHTPRDARRTKSVAIVHETADETFRLIVRKRELMTFLPVSEPTAVDDTPEHQFDTKLQTQLTAEGLQKRLLGLYRDAKTLEEEQGVNILYLAIGFLRWFEDRNSEILREAPLILVPVALVRNNSRSSFRLAVREDEVATNLPLQERLRQDGIILPDIPENEDWSPSSYFGAVREAISVEPRWSIDENGMMLSFFSFSKLLMFRDLMPENWPNGSLLGHPLLAGLLVDGFPREEPLFPEDARLDEIFDPANLVHVVDADASQALVIETVRRERSLVVQGPPGTGKSQTIANIIAAAVHDGKTVLFIAEKMVALKVVYDRLEKAGLGDVCLELHSRQANKRSLVQEIDRTLHVHAAGPPGDGEVNRLREIRNYLNENAARLHKPLVPSGVTPYRMLGQQVKLADEGYPPPEISLPGAANWTESKTRELAAKVQHLADLTEKAGPKDAHPWRGVTTLSIQPPDVARLARKLEEFAANMKLIARAVTGIAEALQFSSDRTFGDIEEIIRLLRDVSQPPAGPRSVVRSVVMVRDLERFSRVISAGIQFHEIWQSLDGAFVNAAWNVDLGTIRRQIAAGVNSWLTRLRRPYRQASRELQLLLTRPHPKRAKDRIALIDTLTHAKLLRAQIEAEKEFCAGVLGADWQGLRTDFEILKNAVAWIRKLADFSVKPSLAKCVDFTSNAEKLVPLLDNLAPDARKAISEIVDLICLDTMASFGAKAIDEVRITALVERANNWTANIHRLEEWGRLALADRIIREDGAADLADQLADGRLEPRRAVGELIYARAEALWKIAVSQDPKLAQMNGEQRSRFVSEFCALERDRRKLVAQEIRAKHRATMPVAGTGLAIIRGEIARQRGHMPVRKLVQRAGKTLQETKPVFLMSPLSVAQFLAPQTVNFDLLVIDEASQIRPEDALGAIARAKQIVVVGDKKQLPPTTFFNRLIDDDDEIEGEDESENTPLAGAARATQLESILALCEARGIADRMLSWHYRSRHPSLIEVSNDEFYKNRLFLPPSPQMERGKLGLIVHRVNGAYDRGGKKTNEIEAHAVVDAVARHVQENPDLSLGIVTFSISQRDLIEDLLEMRRRDDRDIDAFMQTEQQEDTFVKNLENVQGDERDVVILSVGYGPRIAGSGLDSMHFGPVSADGGERRLNVLFTRARHRCEIFVSFNSGDIDLARTTKEGPRVLKRFLRFAETGTLDLPTPKGDADSPFEEAVAKAITEIGYIADPQVGSAGFKIDLGVKHPDHPGRYLLAVECDGATYHSARWARERDRLRQEVLENLGWTFHRIWSTDWFRNPSREKHKLAEAIEKAMVHHGG